MYIYYIYIHVYIHMCTNTHTYTHIYTHIYILRVYLSPSLYIYIYLWGLSTTKCGNNQPTEQILTNRARIHMLAFMDD